MAGRACCTTAPRQDAQRLAIPPEHKDSDDFGPLMKMLGTTDRHFAKSLFDQLLSASGRGIDKFDGWPFVRA